MNGEKDFTSYLQALSSPFPQSQIIPKFSIPYVVMIVSPHPDDESICSSLALRLMKENNAHVINVAVTLGSNKKRQNERLKELTDATDLLEMESLVLSEDWKLKSKELKSLIQKYAPNLIIAPHAKDLHPTHVKTHKLVLSALNGLKIKTLVAWSEFWGGLEKPNLLIEIPQTIVELQVRALSKHQGEIIRNPFHLRLGSWMIDNVRRGGEIINNTGGNPPQFAFGSIYQIQKVINGKFSNPKLISNFLSSYADLAQIFSEIFAPASGSRTKVK